jgi:hypothetical protein
VNDDFEDIKIVEFDDAATYKDDPGSILVNAVLKLSAPAPYEWSNHFNQRWAEHFYMRKRQASVSGERLEVYCVPDELHHLVPELSRVMIETNQAYRRYVAQEQQLASQRAAAEKVEREQLSQIKNSLKFD